MDRKDIMHDVSSYYTEKINRFGATPQGVDWNGEEGQTMRFNQLTKVIVPTDSNISVFDYGCGFGSLSGFLTQKGISFSYHGYDISEEMILQAKSLKIENASWSTEVPIGKKFNYVIASGIFNVRLNHSNDEWLKYVTQVLNEMDALSTDGFAFNMLTKYSDAPYMKEHLYYADPAAIFNHCIENFSRKVDLLHGYQLYEFSILVRKNLAK